MTTKQPPAQKHVALAREIVGQWTYHGKGYDPSSPFSDHGYEALAERIAAALSQVESEALRTVAATLADNSIDKIESGTSITLAPKEPEVKAQGLTFEEWFNKHPDIEYDTDKALLFAAFLAGQASQVRENKQ